MKFKINLLFLGLHFVYRIASCSDRVYHAVMASFKLFNVVFDILSFFHYKNNLISFSLNLFFFSEFNLLPFNLLVFNRIIISEDLMDINIAAMLPQRPAFNLLQWHEDIFHPCVLV